MKGKRILIIDDDPVIVKYLEELFNNNRYEISVAYDGLEADDIVKEVLPDLITLDLDMPNEWGTIFYRKLTKIEGGKDIPVIIISGLPGREHSIKKAVAYFGKPFDEDKLMETVKNEIG